MPTDTYRVAVFSHKPYDKEALATAASLHTTGPVRLDINYLEPRLCSDTVALAADYDCVCLFVNDEVNASTARALSQYGVSHIALRCAGYNNIDVSACHLAGISISHVPAYAPEAVAEHAMALILTLNRKMHKAYNRVKEGNFELQGLLGFTLFGKTIGVIGTGKIGKAFIKIARGFGCSILCYDPAPDQDITDSEVRYAPLNVVLSGSDIVSLHCPLTPQTAHIINHDAIQRMKQGVMLINTSRGGLVDTNALVSGLKTGHLGYVGLDVYEMESDLFFRDRSCEVIQDDTFQRLSTFHNVLITGHQGFFTQEAVSEIAQITIKNMYAAANGHPNSRFL
ncbi:2-hydroxyacid dehydrogenase [Alteromonas oceanisediminis]|uniref:2-hydroxyacid dehydrogenase n=1 Tax=Alteromonas oceanisediminis TaxID=2836180 RepID=UPI001BDAAC8B|nr:2-hydroxyacid dehydrogenase [Alteromonas oceanisediminis]MBT0587208.1 2-hydroxyacid dehydrogenase [Alteromonas oceanisediminis]